MVPTLSPQVDFQGKARILIGLFAHAEIVLEGALPHPLVNWIFADSWNGWT